MAGVVLPVSLTSEQANLIIAVLAVMVKGKLK